MQIRLECTVDGLRQNWVELAEQWTRAEMRRWNLATLGVAPPKAAPADGDPNTPARTSEDELFDLLAQKLTGVHVTLPDGTLIEDAATLVARFDDLDVRLVRWLATGVSKALQELLALGEAKRRLLFDGVEVAQPMTPPTPKAR